MPLIFVFNLVLRDKCMSHLNKSWINVYCYIFNILHGSLLLYLITEKDDTIQHAELPLCNVS